MAAYVAVGVPRSLTKGKFYTPGHFSFDKDSLLENKVCENRVSTDRQGRSRLGP